MEREPKRQLPKLVVERIEDSHHPLIEEMLKLEGDSFGEGAVDAWTMPYLIRHGRVLAVIGGGILVGLAEAIRDFDDRESAYLVGLSVKEEYRELGAGSLILSALLEELKAVGVMRLSLTVSPENVWALHLYRDKFGFGEVALEPDEYGEGEDRLRMELTIS